MCTVCDDIAELRKRVKALEETALELLQKPISGITRTYGVKEAALLINRSSYTTSELCRTGKIKAGRDGDDGNWIITEKAINDFIELTQKKCA